MTSAASPVNRDHVALAVRTATGVDDVDVSELVPYEYAKSAPLYAATVTISDRAVPVLVKDVTMSALLAGASHVKPSFLHNPRREPAIYRDVLGDVDGPAAYFGHHFDPVTATTLLVVEHVDGLELVDVGELSVWTDTARWLGAFHASHNADAVAGVDVIVHDRELYSRWLERAISAAQRLPAPELRRVEHVLDVYRSTAIDRLVAAPPTLVHGELYPSNVIIGGAQLDGTLREVGIRICPVDWETAGVGPAMVDLAALTTGDWTPDARDSMVHAYQETSGAVPGADFDVELAVCQLQLAVQWMGWFVGHAPPSWHARSWIDEAERAASRIT